MKHYIVRSVTILIKLSPSPFTTHTQWQTVGGFLSVKPSAFRFVETISKVILCQATERDSSLRGVGRVLGFCSGYYWTSFTVAAAYSHFGDNFQDGKSARHCGRYLQFPLQFFPCVAWLLWVLGARVGGRGGGGGECGRGGVKGGVKLQALVYDIRPCRKVPESDARSVCVCVCVWGGGGGGGCIRSCVRME